MYRKPVALFHLIMLFSLSNSYADEGMWMPNKLQSKDSLLKARGLKIPIEEIYSEISPSLKDAVVQFGPGCTGEIISEQGLILTNFHCAHSQIQSLSTIENNYLQNGFWALKKSMELACPGLTVTLIKNIEDVTDKILSRLDPEADMDARNLKIAELVAEVEKEAMKETMRQARVKSFFNGNHYFLYYTETFKDVRLVGTPPASLGKFGADTDNWIWPRHTCDFSLFRIYADSANRPAAYSPDNIPYKPIRSLTISSKGIKEGDLTMVYGFPGKTTEYISSYGVELIQNTNDPVKVNIRDRKLSIWKSAMMKNDTVNLKYSSKYQSVSNAWKKWKGEMLGLRKSNVIAEKKEYERKFLLWLNEDGKRRDAYSGLLHEMDLFYAEMKPYSLLYDYYNEAILGVELFTFLNNSVKPLVELAANDSITADSITAAASKLMKGVPGFFKNYNAYVDEKVLSLMLELYHDSVTVEFHPDIYSTLKSEYNNNFSNYAAFLFSNSVFTGEGRFMDFLKGFQRGSLKKLDKDPAWLCYLSFASMMREKAEPNYSRASKRIESLQSRYTKAQIEMRGADNMYPDANQTLRFSFGKVQGYTPADAVNYTYQTTLDGVIDKFIPGDIEFDLPEKLLQLYADKDFGSYAENGKVPVAFISDNHTTGGNSGSPVINANGELIGTNFDRVWEGVLSDIQFDENLCRNITLDIRYTLFIIEKLGGAGNLIEEMRIVR